MCDIRTVIIRGIGTPLRAHNNQSKDTIAFLCVCVQRFYTVPHMCACAVSMRVRAAGTCEGCASMYSKGLLDAPNWRKPDTVHRLDAR